MRLATIIVQNHQRPAVVLEDHVIDLVAVKSLSTAAALIPCDIVSILSAGSKCIEFLGEVVADSKRNSNAYIKAGALRQLNAIRFAAPIPLPRMIMAIGANYHEHLKEMNTATPSTPMSFYKSISSVIGHEDEIILPPKNPDMVDWEGEFAVIIGKECYDVNENEARNYIAGYTIVNDVSARDWVAPVFKAQGMMPTIISWEHNILGKLFPTFCPIGPVIVTADEIEDPHNLKIETRLNDQIVQHSNTSDLVFNVFQIISYYSKFIKFLPGDIISTGSPSGVGYGRKPQLFMKDGDIIEVSIEAIGTLRNHIKRNPA